MTSGKKVLVNLQHFTQHKKKHPTLLYNLLMFGYFHYHFKNFQLKSNACKNFWQRCIRG